MVIAKNVKIVAAFSACGVAAFDATRKRTGDKVLKFLRNYTDAGYCCIPFFCCTNAAKPGCCKPWNLNWRFVKRIQDANGSEFKEWEEDTNNTTLRRDEVRNRHKKRKLPLKNRIARRKFCEFCKPVAWISSYCASESYQGFDGNMWVLPVGLVALAFGIFLCIFYYEGCDGKTWCCTLWELCTCHLFVVYDVLSCAKWCYYDRCYCISTSNLYTIIIIAAIARSMLSSFFCTFSQDWRPFMATWDIIVNYRTE